ncbi:hypothetical protein V6N13_074601 [Hibiscus sabdariffa]
MAESAVQFLLEKLAPLFEKEMQLLRGGREEVAYVRGELERMRAFLRVADALEDTDEELKVWVKQIRDIAHDMEDILDEYMLLLTHHHGDGLSAFFHKMSCCIRNMKARYRIASDIQGINSRIRDICDGHRRLRQKFCADDSNTVGNAWQDRRGDALLLDKADVVGINESKKKLIGWLIDSGTERRVISVLGMGGLGKTTLAKQVYDDAEVKKHLPVHAWITVSQSFKLESLLKDMVQQLSRAISKPIPDGVDNMSSYQLKTIIKSWLRKRRVRSCRVHDLVREIIILKSREQNFAVIAKEQTVMWPDKVRRLSIHNTLQNVLQNRFVSQLRSLFMFAVEENPSLHKLFPGGFKLLAVLDMEATPITKFPIDIVNLYYLKYLNLRETKVTIVPRVIGKLHNLETLDLKHAYVTELPVEILQLQRLRHLLVYRYEFESYDYFHSKYGFKGLERIGELQSLQKLSLIEVDQGNGILTELGKLTQLRRLSITKLKKEDGKKLCFSIEKLTCLRALSIISIEENEPIDVEHLVSPPPLLQRLYLRGRLESMPHWIRYHHSLVKVYLKWSRLPEDPLVCLERLPNLVHLELVQVYDGDTLCFKAGGFKKLKHVGLDNFDELQWVQIQVGAMPGLEKLSIQRCKSMEKVPLGIEHLTKLNVLEFFDMPHELIRSLRQDEQGEDYWRVAHIPEVYSTYWRDGAWEVYSLESFIEGESSPRPNTVISSQDLHARWK